MNALAQTFESFGRAICIHPDTGIVDAMALGTQARAERIKACVAGHKSGNEKDWAPIRVRLTGAGSYRVSAEAKILAKEARFTENFRKANFGELDHLYHLPTQM